MKKTIHLLIFSIIFLAPILLFILEKSKVQIIILIILGILLVLIPYSFTEESIKSYINKINNGNPFSKNLKTLIVLTISMIPLTIIFIFVDIVEKEKLPFNILSFSVIGVLLSVLLTTTYNLYNKEEDKKDKENKAKKEREKEINNAKSFIEYNVDKVKHITTKIKNLDLVLSSIKINNDLEEILNTIKEIYKYQNYTTGQNKIYEAEILVIDMKNKISLNIKENKYTKREYEHDIYELNRRLRYAETYIVKE